MTGDGNTVTISSALASIIANNTTAHYEPLHQLIQSTFPGPYPYTRFLENLAKNAERNYSMGQRRIQKISEGVAVW